MRQIPKAVLRTVAFDRLALAGQRARNQKICGPASVRLRDVQRRIIGTEGHSKWALSNFLFLEWDKMPFRGGTKSGISLAVPNSFRTSRWPDGPPRLKESQCGQKSV